MAEPQMLITSTGVRHKVGRFVDERGDGWHQWWLEAACDPWTAGEPYLPGTPSLDCKRCFPSSDASLGRRRQPSTRPQASTQGDQQ